MIKVVVHLTEHAVEDRIINHGELLIVPERSGTAAHFARTLNVIADGYRVV